MAAIQQAGGLLQQTRTTPLRPRRGGFSLVDLLVSMAVVAALIALLMPSLSGVREAARKVVCASNVRQIGLGLAMYADDHEGLLPPTKFSGTSPISTATQSIPSRPQMMMILRTDESPEAWDGLGLLYRTGYLDAAGVFYCPSHHGEHPLARYTDQWSGQTGEISGNYQFRGTSAIRLDAYRDAQSMVADGMRQRSDYNHRIGSNVLGADLTIRWFADPAGQLASNLPGDDEAQSPEAARKVDLAWQEIDRSLRGR